MADTAPRKPLPVPAALAATALLCGFIAWMIESRAIILRQGPEIVLRTAPVDPRDLLRGHFVRLGYDAARIDGAPLDPLRAELDGRRLRDAVVYVRFAPADAGLHEPVAVTLSRPDAMPFLRGRVRFVGPDIAALDVDYGIDRFYADAFRARELERNMREGLVTEIVVAIGRDGTAQIKALRQGGAVIVTEPLY